MNTMTYTDFGKRNDASGHNRSDHRDPPFAVQVLSIIAFGIFSIVGISLAFATFWLAGLVLAVLIAWTWAGSRTFGGRRHWKHAQAHHTMGELAPTVSNVRSSGNASFDGYRADMLKRLEQESRDFEGFLTRLREARDAMEFDKFMDDRASKARDATPPENDDIRAKSTGY